jgi:hypothetical protein
METKIDTALRLSAGLGDATHNLHCTHCQGRSVSHYKMKCILLGITKSGKAKILVFGERHWPGRDHIKRVRYVDEERITELSPNAMFSGPRPEQN